MDPTSLAKHIGELNRVRINADPLPFTALVSLTHPALVDDDGNLVKSYADLSKLDPSDPNAKIFSSILEHASLNSSITADDLCEWAFTNHKVLFDLHSFYSYAVRKGLMIQEEDIPDGTSIIDLVFDGGIPTKIQERNDAIKEKIVLLQPGFFDCIASEAPTCPICSYFKQDRFVGRLLPTELLSQEISTYKPVKKLEFYATSTCLCSEDLTWKVTVDPVEPPLFEYEENDRLSRLRKDIGPMRNLPNNR